MGLQLAAVLLLLDGLYLLVGVDAEHLLYYEHGGDDADHSEGIGGGIAHRHLLGDSVGLGVDLEHGLLSGAQAGGVGDCAGHDAHHLHEVGVAVCPPLDEVDGQGDADVDGDAEHGQQVEADASLLERREEAGANLHAYGEDEQDETELTQEVKRVCLHRITEVAHENAHKEHEGYTQRHAEYLDLAQPYAREDDERIEQHGAREGHVPWS